jgi:hypothetical protein
MPDPIASFTLPRRRNPTREQMMAIVKALCELANVHAVNFYSPFIFVELHSNNGEIYEAHSLPGRVAGHVTLYHHIGAPFWKEMVNQAHERLIDPSQGTASGTRQEDNTDYLLATNALHPGVRLESSTTTEQGAYAESSRSTTAGALLRGPSGQIRMTAANHGFLNSDEVYHPTNSGTRIGDIDERWKIHDIALVKLNPSIHFDNSIYFQVRSPTRLLRGNDIQQGTWYAVDGMSTGLVYLFSRGVRLEVPPRSACFPPIEYSDFLDENIIHQSVFVTAGPTGGGAADGLCGAPIIEDDFDCGGGVAGFFQLADGNHCLAPVLDELIDRGWAIV